MARYVFKIISVKDISSNLKFSSRYRLEDADLQRSISARGLIQPLILAAGGKELAAGFRRFHALKNLRIQECPALEIQEKLSEQDIFLMSVLSNWKQEDSELDRAYAVAKAVKEFKFSEKQIEEEILPALGISSGSGFLEESLKVFSLESALIDLIADGKIPFRGAKVLERLSKADQKTFAQVGQKAALTTNQILKAGEWLGDLLKSSGKTLEVFLKENNFGEILDHKGSDRRGLGEQFFAKLKGLRYPQLTQKEEAFQALSEQLRQGETGLNAEAPPYFESSGMTLRIQVKDSRTLDKITSVLEAKRKLLNSLLDIVL